MLHEIGKVVKDYKADFGFGFDIPIGFPKYPLLNNFFESEIFQTMILFCINSAFN